MILGINDTLLNHLATSAGPASIIRNACPGITDLAAAFFRTRTDIKRLSAAQDVANAILENNDLRDLMAIRDIVARQELRRQIKYGKQQDHTAHTVYLYFLGLWLHDNVSAIAKAVKNQYRRSQTTGGADEYFLLQWAYASLLHDVGYAFHSLAPEKVTESFDYSPRNLVTDFVSACRAVAFHNVQPSVGAAAAIIPRIRLDREPITFLAVLCDELQRWDRAPAGSTHLDSYRVFAEAAIESSDVQILAEGSRTDSRARFLVRAPATPRSEEDLLKAFTTALATRLPRYSDVLDIEVLNR